jgi:hypothetical protein
MPEAERVVDNRVLFLALDKHYRDTVSTLESQVFLEAARAVSARLASSPPGVVLRALRWLVVRLGLSRWRVPTPNWEAQSTAGQLMEYTELLHALQREPASRRHEVADLPESQLLYAFVTSGLFGVPVDDEHLLPQGRDALYDALERTKEWTVPTLVSAAQEAARISGDYSLVGIAALIGDAACIAGARESTEKYGAIFVKSFERPVYVWRVDPEVAAAAKRFVSALNRFSNDQFPPPEAENAGRYWKLAEDHSLAGRCVRIADDPRRSDCHYHWAVVCDSGSDTVREFWSDSIWDTERFSQEAPSTTT